MSPVDIEADRGSAREQATACALWLQLKACVSELRLREEQSPKEGEGFAVPLKQHQGNSARFVRLQ